MRQIFKLVPAILLTLISVNAYAVGQGDEGMGPDDSGTEDSGDDSGNDESAKATTGEKQIKEAIVMLRRLDLLFKLRSSADYKTYTDQLEKFVKAYGTLGDRRIEADFRDLKQHQEYIAALERKPVAREHVANGGARTN